MTQTVHQTRRERLELLIAEHRSIAALNSAMGMRRDDATFSLIRNQSAHSATKKPRVMGDELARKVEVTLGLPVGWMDTPITTLDARIEHVVSLLEGMSEPLRDQAMRVVDALAASVPPEDARKDPVPPPAPTPAPVAAEPRPSAAPKPEKPEPGDPHGRGGAHAERHGLAASERAVS